MTSESSDEEVLLKAPILATPDDAKARTIPEPTLKSQVLKCLQQAVENGSLQKAFCESSDAKAAKEKRCLQDGIPYSLAEFLEYFGDEEGMLKWECAQTLPRASLAPTEAEARHDVVQLLARPIPPPDSVEQSRIEVFRMFKAAAVSGRLDSALDLDPRVVPEQGELSSRTPTSGPLCQSITAVKEESPRTSESAHGRRLMPSWWDRNFTVQYRHDDSLVGVRLKGVGLGDVDIGSICIALDSFLARKVDPNMLLELEIDLSDNELSDQGGLRICGWLRGLLVTHVGGVRLRILKMYKNRLSNAACEALAALLLELQWPIEELHLSHNSIEQRGFTALLASLPLHPGRVYPRQTRGDPCPCWLRIEHNEVVDTQDLLEALAREPVKLRTCLAPKTSTGLSCSSFQCCADVLGDGSAAHAHLYCVHSQSSPSSAVREKPQQLVREIAAAIEERTLRPTMGELKVGDGLVGEPAMQDAVPYRIVLLNVGECGAGIDLTATAYGYIVESVEEHPGQDLQVGNVIVQIADETLWGLDEESLSDAFGSRFGDRAPLHVVANEQDLKRRSIWQSLPLAHGESAKRCDSQHWVSYMAPDFLGDLAELGRRCHVKAELILEHCAVAFHGSPQAQRWAVMELPALVQYYFPECHSNVKWPSAQWCSQASDEVAETHHEFVEAANHPEEANELVDLQDLASWGTALHRQWTEDSNLFDEDLPCDPLEAPDDGPDMFDGVAFDTDADFSWPLRIIILAGLPGSGKSTLARQLWDMGWHTVNQDTLGDRKACVAAAKKYLQAGRRIVIDRCNVSHIQRRVWLDIAEEFEVCVGCIWLIVDAEECGRRVLKRFGHQTLPADRSSLQVIASFEGSFEKPVLAEGFLLWPVRGQDEIDVAIAQIMDAAEYSEVEYAENATMDSHRSKARQGGKDNAQRNAGKGNSENSGFRYVDLRTHGARGKFLRAVRRQIEYYFSDPNLKQDWFFQEKIAEAPEAGWLELRWILSCPRIQKQLKASDEDVREALVPSNLMIKQVNGVFWVRRGRPLPPLVEPRPEKGCEPDWYRKFHERDAEGGGAKSMLAAIDDSSDAEHPRCIACGIARPKADFSKAQLTKHRKTPTCKDCVNAQ